MEKCDILECDFNKAIDIIKSRFVCAVIISISEGKTTFSDIANDFSYLTNASLSRTLKQLCSYNIIEKQDNTYKLTKSGLELIDIIDTLDKWYTRNF